MLEHAIREKVFKEQRHIFVDKKESEDGIENKEPNVKPRRQVQLSYKQKERLKGMKYKIVPAGDMIDQREV